MELEQEPGKYISGSRARQLLQAGRARLSAGGKLRLLAGAGAMEREQRPRWTAYSGRGGRQAYHMMGKAINRSV